MDAMTMLDEIAHLNLSKKKREALRNLRGQNASAVRSLTRDNKLLYKRIKQLKRELSKKEEEIRSLKGLLEKENKNEPRR